jgi:hypothetical protein
VREAKRLKNKEMKKKKSMEKCSLFVSVALLFYLGAVGAVELFATEASSNTELLTEVFAADTELFTDMFTELFAVSVVDA